MLELANMKNSKEEEDFLPSVMFRQ